MDTDMIPVVMGPAKPGIGIREYPIPFDIDPLPLFYYDILLDRMTVLIPATGVVVPIMDKEQDGDKDHLWQNDLYAGNEKLLVEHLRRRVEAAETEIERLRDRAEKAEALLERHKTFLFEISQSAGECVCTRCRHDQR